MPLKKYALYILVFAATALTSCRKDDVPNPGGPKERTFFIYMAADNSLGYYNGASFDYPNIESLLSGVKASHLQKTNVILFHDPKIAYEGEESGYVRPDEKPRLLEVVIGSDGKTTTRDAVVYEELNSGTAATLKQILTKVVADYPAEKYGFLMWSHGTGWLPANPNFTTSRAIGQDNRGTDSWIEIGDFADAIPDGQFDFIALDACYMGSAEVAYELRNKTDYILASPIEIMGNGMPYQLMPDLLFPRNPNYNGFCDAFYNMYASTYGCTISLVKTSELEALAATVHDILKDADLQADIIEGIPSGSLQRFGRLTYRNVFFDLGDFVQKLATPSQYETFQLAMQKAVPYSRHTDSFFKGNTDGFDITATVVWGLMSRGITGCSTTITKHSIGTRRLIGHRRHPNSITKSPGLKPGAFLFMGIQAKENF